ncbi:MAG: glycosyltransferase [Cyanobacteria bacterium P01_C01_bin.72]
MKVALVHDYLTQRGGAERVFEMLCRFFDQGDVFSSVYDQQSTVDIQGHQINTTFLQNAPGAKQNFRLFAPLYYSAFRQLDLGDYDLIISSTSSFAKGVKKKPGAMHICFCHNVTRFLWDTRTYLEENSSYRRIGKLIEPILQSMRQQDLKYAKEPDLYIANSTTVARRIREIYDRKAMVINYPIDTDKFIFSAQKEDYYLISSRMISYKRLDIAIEAFNWLGLPLVITGDGPERKRLEAKSLDNIQFLGYVDDKWRTHLMAKAKAVVVTALEDYGLVPIEANASGTPVIAYGAGGVLDTQVAGKTGFLFTPQSPDALQTAIRQVENQEWDYAAIRAHAVDNFSESVFFQQVAEVIQEFCGQSILDELGIKSEWLKNKVTVGVK